MEEPRCRRHRQLVVMPKAVKQAWLTALLSQGLGERAGAPGESLWILYSERGKWEKHQDCPRVGFSEQREEH